MVQFIEYEKTNRENKMTASKGHKYWCSKCDAQLVGEFGKCPNCGYTERRNKKKGF